jgi:hypothetical protein
LQLTSNGVGLRNFNSGYQQFAGFAMKFNDTKEGPRKAGTHRVLFGHFEVVGYSEVLSLEA